MKTKNNFANLKSSVAIVIAVFMLTFSISATETSKDCKPGKTLNSSKEFVECENGNAITALADIFEQIESTVKFKGPSVQDEDEINMALANNSPETFSGMNNDQLANKVNSTEEFVECESTSAYKALADIIGQIESSIKFKGPSVQDEEESNLTLARNSPETCLEMKDDQLANKLNSSEEFVECENTSAYKALDDIIGQIENSIKFKVALLFRMKKQLT